MLLRNGFTFGAKCSIEYEKNSSNIGIVGNTCSGKSTFAEYYTKFHDVFRINRDDLRKMLRFSEQMEFYDENLLSDITYSPIATALAKGMEVLVDNTHAKQTGKPK